MYLGAKGYTVYKTNQEDATLAECRRNLTVAPIVPKIVSTTRCGPSFPIYRECESKLYVPLYYGLDLFGEPPEIRLPAGDNINLAFTGDLRAPQNAIVNKYMASLRQRAYGGGVLDVATGSGKTVMALNIISRLQKKTLIIVHKTFLLNQWLERASQFLPHARIGRIQRESFDIDDKDIVIAMLQTLSMKEYSVNAFRSFGLLVCDECHHLSAEVFVRALQKVVVPHTLGLSATMQRKDGLSKVFKYFLGPVLHKDSRKSDRCVWVKKISYVSDDDDYRTTRYDHRGNVVYSSMITRLCAYKPRQDFIGEVILRQMSADFSHSDKKQQMMVLSHNKSLLTYLRERLSTASFTVGYYVGGMKESDLKCSEFCDVILATYAMASEGLDIKSLTTLLMATPKTDVIQSIGRVLRTDGHRPTIIDIVDSHDVFQSQWKKRNSYYRKMKFNIHSYTNDEYLRGVLDELASESASSSSTDSEELDRVIT